MDRRAFICGLALGILDAPIAAEAQQTGRVYRIGYLTVPSRETAQGVANSFQLGLRDLGWIESQNVVIDYRFADSNLDRLPDLATELARLRADVIVAGANAAVIAAKSATRTIPIVMFLTFDPVGSGLVTSLARPGANVTGLTTTWPGNLWQATTATQGRLPATLPGRSSCESSLASLCAFIARS